MEYSRAHDGHGRVSATQRHSSVRTLPEVPRQGANGTRQEFGERCERPDLGASSWQRTSWAQLGRTWRLSTDDSTGLDADKTSHQLKMSCAGDTWLWCSARAWPGSSALAFMIQVRCQHCPGVRQPRLQLRTDPGIFQMQDGFLFKSCCTRVYESVHALGPHDAPALCFVLERALCASPRGAKWDKRKTQSCQK